MEVETVTYCMQYSPLRNYIISATQNISTLLQRRKVFFFFTLRARTAPPPNHITLYSILILPSYLRLGIQSDAFHLHGR
jgi:hypothetical protein